MMALLIGIMTIVESVVTVYIMVIVIDLVNGMKAEKLRASLLKFFERPLIALVVNFGVSRLLVLFTGAGMIAGAANLISSVIVTITFKYIYIMHRNKLCHI